MEQLKIIKKEGEIFVPFEVAAERVDCGNHRCFIFLERILVVPDQSKPDVKETRTAYNISHLETGLNICIGEDRAAVIAEATKLLAGADEVLETGRELCRKFNIVLPVNT